MQKRNLMPNTLTYTALLSGYNMVGRRSEMFALFDEMIAKDIEPDGVTWSVMIDVHLKEGDHVKTLKLVDDMLKKGGNVSKNVCHVLIDALCRKEHTSEVLKALEKIKERGLNLSPAACCTLVRRFHKAGEMDGAARVLKSMVRFKWVPDSTELNDLINEEQDSTDSENTGDFLKQMAWEVAYQVRA
ncbi:hypothetical protein OIU84_007286 [Salix udensis]|uniref:Pentatricopeptide repeat-containing protein n=1 Tax=Salix udensis TaxID=889485 RepID=A0AAD6JTA3_9ROSI|nr:hypothetical protein OIU84_007286 [Salix udensis]KAJ6410509.1 hypothetical protein OIU84_007286 [Salix udensis]